ncbi:preprotein translocase, SecG subunit [Phenylobacterium zucineum HLK1]|uniref:Protein-export membrane protein SecG n=1 Tax=Phenylobacterium zucineum (strain HLK1) TaxID=450851 RepID=B4RBW6_PHEZH|nr:preprotein translocase subunit SecG [Phenylobacterium zucineum]ACG78163.1 preprotein translocase, SecG subunit [Phenylobacterium zucineum HLK1]
MLLTLLLVIEVIVAFFLIVVVLLQRSEGGALGMGGGPSGFMTARGAGDLMTRITWILGSVFFVLGLLLTIMAGREGGSSSVVDRLKVDAIDPNSLNQSAPQPTPAAPAQGGPAPLQAPAPVVGNPFGAQPAPTAPQPAPQTAPAPAAPQ